MATTKNLTIDQGSSFSESVTYRDTNKNPVSLSGYDIQGMMRKSYYSANAIVFTTTVTDATNGNIVISLNFNQTANVAAGRYVYDVRANTANTAVRIQEGIITVNPGVTI